MQSKHKVQFEQHAQGSKQGKNAELYISPLTNAFFDQFKSTAWSRFLVLAFRAGLFLLRDYSEYELYRPLFTVCFVPCWYAWWKRTFANWSMWIPVIFSKYGCGNCATWKLGYMNLWSWCFLFLYYVSEEWVNNWWWGWWNRTDLGKGTHQCNETQENNSTHALLSVFFASFFFCCLPLFLHPKKTIFVERACVLLFPCVSSHWWVHFPRCVLFCIVSVFCIICILLTSTHLILVQSWRMGYWGIQALDGWQHCFEIQERVQSAVVRMVPSYFYCCWSEFFCLAHLTDCDS